MFEFLENEEQNALGTKIELIENYNIFRTDIGDEQTIYDTGLHLCDALLYVEKHLGVLHI